MKVSFFSSVMESLTKGFFFLLPSVAPNWTDVFVAKFLKTIDEYKGISNRMNKNYFSWRKLTIWIRSVAQLHHCSQEAVSVKGSRGAGV